MTDVTVQKREERGFTLIELVIAIAVVGILAAVAIVGVGGLLGKSRTASCNATVDAARAGAAVHLANSDPPKYPATAQEMKDNNELTVGSGVTVAGNTITGKNWAVTMSGGGSETTPPTFSACP